MTDKGKRRGLGIDSKRLLTFLLNRRDFLKLAGVSATAVAAPGCENGDPTSVATSAELHVAEDLPFDFSLSFLRKEDFLSLRFDFINFEPDGHFRNLRRKQAGPAFILVNFPSQHLFEPAYFEGASDETPVPVPELPIPTRLSGPTRIALTVPDAVDELPLSLDDLLELLGGLEMHLHANALPSGERPSLVASPVVTLAANLPEPKQRISRTARLLRRQRGAFAERHWHELLQPAAEPLLAQASAAPTEPFNHETALELPFRLLLSPDRNGGWAHSTTPVAGTSGRIELWHTRLGVRKDGRIDERDPALRKVRAIWTRDKGFRADNPESTSTEDPVFDLSNNELETLEPIHRSKIVHLTSNFERYSGTGENPLPRPVDANLLMLSGMGGWLDVRGEWLDTDIQLEEWEHRATFGRDHYVKVVLKGVLYPFGHMASLFALSERKFHPDHEHIALLRKRFFIVVREPEKRYEIGRGTDGSEISKGFRQLPFTALRVTTLVTPNLDVLKETRLFVPKTGGALVGGQFQGGEPYRFKFEGLDREGNIIRFSAPVVWIGVDADQPEPTDVADARDLYNGQLDVFQKRCHLDGQRLAYALGTDPDDTTHETDHVTFAAQQFDGSDPANAAINEQYPLFFPLVASADIVVEALRHVAGVGQNASRTFTYHEAYVNNDFSTSGNAGELLLKATETSQLAVSFATKSDRSGGFLSPSFQLLGLSRKIGPVAGNNQATDPGQDAINGDFNPEKFFEGTISPKIFGVIDLVDILAKTKLDRAPKYFTNIISGAMGVVADLERLVKDLVSAGYPDPSALGSAAQLLFDDLDTAFNPTSPDQAAATGRIAGRVTAVVAELPGVSAVLAGIQVSPLALKTALLARAAAMVGSLSGAVPALLDQIANLALAAELPKEIRTRMEWRGRVKEAGGIFFPNHPDPTQDNTQDSLLLLIDITARSQGEPQIDLRCTLEDFSIKLFAAAHFLTLIFDLVEFRIQNGKKPDVRVVFNDLEFAGPLKFIENLRHLIPLDGFSDPPNVDVTPTGIEAGFTVALPNIAVGILSLENISLSAAVRIPFDGDPLTFSFAFSTRENPFNLTVSLLGGGGFFGLRITPAGVEMLEAALEAGARISVDFGVASGSVSAMLGIYFRIEEKPDGEEMLLTGYFRLRGEVDVLGLISVSIQLALSLTYHLEPVNKLIGRAELEIEIEIAFFSESVTITCERRFAGSNGDPTFFDIMRPDGNYRPWNDYVAAFAA